MEEIVNRIKELYVACPDCEGMYDDDQYTCTTCWCQGGHGVINVYEWMKENPKALIKS